MLALYKSVLPGALLSYIFSTVLGNNGTSGGALYIRMVGTPEVQFYWSWPLFLAGAFLAWAIFHMME